MSQKVLQNQLDEINLKLDTIQSALAQIGSAANPSSKQMSVTAKSRPHQQDNGSSDRQGEDLEHLLLNVQQNAEVINHMIGTVKSASDFSQDLLPLMKVIFDDIVEKLDRLEQKGYFRFLREIGNIVDTVVTNFSEEDIRLLRENIVSILMTIKNMTQPEMLATIDNAVGFYNRMDIDINEQNTTVWGLFRQLNTPETRKGLVFLLKFLQNMAGENGHPQVKTR